jgi:hypothetical protein
MMSSSKKRIEKQELQLDGALESGRISLGLGVKREGSADAPADRCRN